MRGFESDGTPPQPGQYLGETQHRDDLRELTEHQPTAGQTQLDSIQSRQTSLQPGEFRSTHRCDHPHRPNQETAAQAARPPPSPEGGAAHGPPGTETRGSEAGAIPNPAHRPTQLYPSERRSARGLRPGQPEAPAR